MIQDLWEKSHHCFVKGLEFFESTHNLSNQALLNANLGGLARMCAETHHLLHEGEGQDEGGKTLGQGEVSVEEEEYCQQALQYYSRGQEVLKRVKTDRNIWYSLESDLAAVHFTLAQKLQERPPLSKRNLTEVLYYGTTTKPID